MLFRRLAVTALCLSSAAMTSCGQKDATEHASDAISATAVAALPSGTATSMASAAPSASALPSAYPGTSSGCAADMVRVEGEYCPALTQNCLEHHSEFETANGAKNVSERCVLYEKPSRCVSKKRRKLVFCMD